MKEYWFQKRGGAKYVPVNWKGWALFAFVIGLVVSTLHWSSNPLFDGIYAAVVAALGYAVMDLKRAPDSEVIDTARGRKASTILIGSVVGLLGSLLVFISVLTIPASLNPDRKALVNSTTETVPQFSNTSPAAATENAPTTTTTTKSTPADAGKPSAVDAAKSGSVDAIYQTYKNPTMSISSLLYPKTWTVTESSDKLSVTFDAPDKHADLTATLYAGDTSNDLQTLFSEAQQGSQQKWHTDNTARDQDHWRTRVAYLRL